MISYFIALLLPAGLLLVADRRVLGRRARVVLIAFALLVPCVIAGARDSGIGLDTLGYGDQVYHIAVSHNWDWNGFLNEVRNSGYDIGLAYSLMTFLTVGVTGSKFCYYFVIQLLILSPLYYAMCRISKGKYKALSYIVIYLLFYMLGLSAMRQFIALSIGFLSVVELINSKYSLNGVMRSVLLIITAVLFHNSAAILLVCHLTWISGVTYDAERPKLRKYTINLIPIIWVAIILVALFIDPIFRAVTSTIPLFERYASYLITSGTSDGFTFFIFFGAMIAAPVYRGRNLLKERDPQFIFLLSFALLSLVIYSLQSYNEEFIRLSYYFWPFVAALFIYSLDELSFVSCADVHVKAFIPELTYLVFCFGQFSWWYLINDYWNCLPYSSSFLSSLF